MAERYDGYRSNLKAVATALLDLYAAHEFTQPFQGRLQVPVSTLLDAIEDEIERCDQEDAVAERQRVSPSHEEAT